VLPAHGLDLLAAVDLPQDPDFIFCAVFLAFHYLVPFGPRLTHHPTQKNAVTSTPSSVGLSPVSSSGHPGHCSGSFIANRPRQDGITGTSAAIPTRISGGRMGHMSVIGRVSSSCGKLKANHPSLRYCETIEGADGAPTAPDGLRICLSIWLALIHAGNGFFAHGRA